MVAQDGIRTDGGNGKRTGHTGHQRSLTVNNGHSKTGADLGRNALTRLGEDFEVGFDSPQLHRTRKMGIWQDFYTKW